MKAYLALITLTILVPTISALEQNSNATSEFVTYREARRSSVADSCVTNEDTTGTCMSRFKCLNSGGVPKGYCSSFGVCCESRF